MSTSADWLPRAVEGNGRGDLLRRSFADRLERRETADTGASVEASLERLRAAEVERQAALAAIGELSGETRALLATVLSLPADVQISLSALLA